MNEILGTFLILALGGLVMWLMYKDSKEDGKQ